LRRSYLTRRPFGAADQTQPHAAGGQHCSHRPGSRAAPARSHSFRCRTHVEGPTHRQNSRLDHLNQHRIRHAGIPRHEALRVVFVPPGRHAANYKPCEQSSFWAAGNARKPTVPRIAVPST
jgi:hypothetical protein